MYFRKRKSKIKDKRKKKHNITKLNRLRGFLPKNSKRRLKVKLLHQKVRKYKVVNLVND